MSFYDFHRANELNKRDEPFYGLIMAAMLRADTDNLLKLRHLFPEVHQELDMRYHAPGGFLPEELPKEDDDKAVS